MRSKTSPVPRPGPASRSWLVSDPGRTVAQLVEVVVAEVPRTLRRIGFLFLALAISIPVFLVGLLIVLWRLGG